MTKGRKGELRWKGLGGPGGNAKAFNRLASRFFKALNRGRICIRVAQRPVFIRCYVKIFVNFCFFLVVYNHIISKEKMAAMKKATMK